MYGTIGLIRDRKDMLQQRHEQEEVRRRTLLQQQNKPIVVVAAGVAVHQPSHKDHNENAGAARTRPTNAAAMVVEEPKTGAPLAPTSLATMMIMTTFPPSAVSGCCTSVVDGITPPAPFVPVLNTAATTTTSTTSSNNNYSARPAWYF
jgi:hypothetical protein